MLTPIMMKQKSLKLLDQRKLPLAEEWIDCDSLEKVALAIETMVVRGAPAIGCAAGFGLLVDVSNANAMTWGGYRKTFRSSLQRLSLTRPTAINLFYALNLMKNVSSKFNDNTPIEEVIEVFSKTARGIYESDIATCKAIGNYGLELVEAGTESVSVLTHCNAGALATAAYGTALGVIRSLNSAGKINNVYVDETRPWLQGARLTAYELQQESIPHCLISDSAAATLMRAGKVDFVVVGADRIASNGDVANKVGTYSLAVNAKFHGVKFYVAAPLSTFDMTLLNGADIPIEERNPDEITSFCGVQIAPVETPAYNPSFDVTPNELIDGIITEAGIFRAPYFESIRNGFTEID